MDRSTAFNVLDLQEGATEAQVYHRVEERRTALEERLGKAPTMALKGKYRNEIAKLDEAKQALLEISTPGESFGDLPVPQKIGLADDMEPGGGREEPGPSNGRRPPLRPPAGGTPASRRPPPRADPTGDPSQRAPQRRVGAPADGDLSNRRPPSRPQPQALEEPEDDYGEVPPIEKESGPPPEPRPAWIMWSIVSGILLLLAIAGYGAWKWWYVPGQITQHKEQGARVLGNLAPEVSRMAEDGERAHGKVRSLSWLAVALSSTGRGGEASGLVSEAGTMIAKLEGSLTKDEDQCRLLAAQAAKGDSQGATATLVTLQAAREKAARGGRPVAPNAPPLRVPLHEDNARRSIAIALARQNQPRQAISMVNSISPAHDDFACEALSEVARQLVSTGDSQQAIQAVQTLELKAKKIVDPLARAPLLAFVAEQMQSLLGSTKAKPFISDALGGMSGFSSGSASGPPPSDIEARKAIAQAIMLPVAMRMGGEPKDTYRKKLEDVTALASSLQANTGTISGQPDFKNRARAYSACAVAWAELGSHWFSGDAQARAEDAVAKAIECAEQVKPPAKLTGAEEALTVQHQKEQALTAVVAALSQMHEFAKAREIVQRITLAENLGAAGEVLAYHLGGAGKGEDAEALLRDIPEGEARTRAAVAFHYGINHLPLEKWW